MHEVALDLLILLVGIWLVAVTLRPLGLPTVMGELIVGVLVGPAVLGLIEPGEAIQLLAEIGIFFLMFHAGVETQPIEFYDALKRSLGVAVVGALVPFGVSFGLALAFGLDWVGATFVGLTMTATAVVITLKCLRDLRLDNTRMARVIVAACVIDDLLTLIVFGLVIGVLSGGTFEPANILINLGKVIAFFAVAILLGRFVYPRLTLPFRSEGGKGFTFVLLTAIAWGLVAEAIGLHMILGAYLAGLFFEEKVAHPNLVRVVKDRAYGIAYSFLGPIFFISLGFSITFDITAADLGFIILLTSAVIVGQILSAGGMALRIGLPPKEALTVGVGMCGRAEMAFILASLALAQGAIGQPIFTALIFTAFLLNLFTPLALKGCAVMLEGRAARQANATSGILWVSPFSEPLVEEVPEGQLMRGLPDVRDTVVIYGYGPPVESLMGELESRGIPVVVIEEDEAVARRLLARGKQVVKTRLADGDLDLSPLRDARALVANGPDDLDALLTMNAREQGFTGPIVALIDNPGRRAALQLAGSTTAFTPTHVLAAVVAARASARIGPRITGVEPLAQKLEVAEVRIHDRSPLAGRTLGESGIDQTGVHIVGQWLNDTLDAAPAADQVLEPGMLLVAVGSPDRIHALAEISRPITQKGRIVVAGYGDVGGKLVEMLRDAGEPVFVIHDADADGVDLVGDLLAEETYQAAEADQARAVILAGHKDSTTLLATAVVRDFAPEVPVLACSDQAESVERMLQAGADFALSVSQVAGQFLLHFILGEVISQQARIRLSRLQIGRQANRADLDAEIKDQTGCSLIAVERDGDLIMEIAEDFRFSKDDSLYVCGTAESFNRLYAAFADAPA